MSPSLLMRDIPNLNQTLQEIFETNFIFYFFHCNNFPFVYQIRVLVLVYELTKTYLIY